MSATKPSSPLQGMGMSFTSDKSAEPFAKLCSKFTDCSSPSECSLLSQSDIFPDGFNTKVCSLCYCYVCYVEASRCTSWQDRCLATDRGPDKADWTARREQHKKITKTQDEFLQAYCGKGKVFDGPEGWFARASENETENHVVRKDDGENR
jgi:hypothetical protein